MSLKTIAAAAVAALMLIGAARAEVLRIGTEGAYPPFNQIDPSGELIGFDIDIAQALCDNMKVTCEFVRQDWDGIIPGLLARDYNLLFRWFLMAPWRPVMSTPIAVASRFRGATAVNATS